MKSYQATFIIEARLSLTSDNPYADYELIYNEEGMPIKGQYINILLNDLEEVIKSMELDKEEEKRYRDRVYLATVSTSAIFPYVDKY